MKKPLSKAIKALYGVGDMGFSLMVSCETYLFMFFLTDVAKFSLAWVAVIGSVTTIVDAVLSPIYGGIISGTKPMKWGRNRSWMLITPPIVVLLFMFTFSKVGSEAVAAIIVMASFISSHIIWNIGWVANVSLIPVMANNPEERAMLAAHRGTWTSLAGVFFSSFAPFLAAWYGTQLENEVLGYTLLVATLGLVYIAGFWTVFKITKGYEPTGAEAKAQATAANKVSLLDMLKSAGQNPHLIVLLISDFFRYIVLFVLLASGAYYFTYIALNPPLFAPFLTAGAIAGVVGAYLSAPVAKKISTRSASILSLFGMGIACIIAKFVGMNVPAVFVLVTIVRFFMGMIGATNVALYADVAIYSEWKTGKNATPFVMGLMNLSLKAALISRSTLIPIALAAAGFVAGVDPAQATDALKNAVLNVFVFIPGMCAIVSGLILVFAFKLTREKVVEYQAEIDARKSA